MAMNHSVNPSEREPQSPSTSQSLPLLSPGTAMFTHCLEHQHAEDQMSPLGLVCPRCKQRLYVAPPRGRGRGYWESQPVAYSLDGRPCFVYTLVWDDFRIRSLHPAHSEHDIRGGLAALAAEMT